MMRPGYAVLVTCAALVAGCFPPLDERADADAFDVADVSTEDSSAAPDTSVITTDTGGAIDVDAHDDIDAGECSDAADCPAVAGPCRERACVDHACRPKNVEASCDDGDLCTTGDHCVAGSCVATPVVCQALDTCHARGACDPGSGTCSHPTRPDDSVCDDDDRCTLTDTCTAGLCVGSGEPDDALANWARPIVDSARQDLCGIVGAGDNTFVLAVTRSGELSLGADFAGNEVLVVRDQQYSQALYAAEFDSQGRPLRARVILEGHAVGAVGKSLVMRGDGTLVATVAIEGATKFGNGGITASGTTGQLAVISLTLDLAVAWVAWTESLGAHGSIADDIGSLAVAASSSNEVAVAVTLSGQVLMHPPVGEAFTLGIEEGSVPGNKDSVAGHLVLLSSVGARTDDIAFMPLDGVLGGLFPTHLGFSSTGRLIVAGSGGGGFKIGELSIPMQPVTRLAPIVLSFTPSHQLAWLARGVLASSSEVSAMTMDSDGQAFVAITDGRLDAWVDKDGTSVPTDSWQGPLIVSLSASGEQVAHAGAFSETSLIVSDVAVGSNGLTAIGTLSGAGVFDGTPPVFVTPSGDASGRSLFGARWSLPDLDLVWASGIGGEGASIPHEVRFPGMGLTAADVGIVVATGFSGAGSFGEAGLGTLVNGGLGAFVLLHLNSANGIGCPP